MGTCRLPAPHLGHMVPLLLTVLLGAACPTVGPEYGAYDAWGGWTDADGGTGSAALPCDVSRGTISNAADGGHALCSVLPEFGLSCQQEFVPAGAPISDIIWVVDNSGSMTEKIAGVQENITRFSSVMAASNVDFRLVMVSNQSQGFNRVCVPQPLASAQCDSSANFLRVDADVESTDGPDILMAQYNAHPEFRAFMRPGSRRSIVFVTDDNYQGEAGSFLQNIQAQPGLRDATVHAVVGTSFSQCPDISTVGSAYLDMANATGGLVLPICCSDYASLVNALALDMAQAHGRFVLEREALPGSVRVYTQALEDGGVGARVPVTSGWTYDPPQHAVQFDAAARPAAGTRVFITYSVR